jgi:hypothetical protein
MSWNLPPEPLLELKYAPSIWRVQKIVIWMLRMAILGPTPLAHLKKADPRFHRLLAEPPRKRKKQVQYPFRALS